MTRITQNMVYGQMRTEIASAQTRQHQASLRASSGLRYTKPSDNPTAASRKTVLDGANARLEAMGAASTRARGTLDAADTALAGINDRLVRAREIAVAGANGTLGDGERDTLAGEVNGLWRGTLALGNTRVDGTYIFAGALTDQPAFDAAGGFAGDQTSHTIEVAPDTFVALNVNGAAAIGGAGGGEDIFGLLADLEAALMGNDPDAVASTLPRIDAALEQLNSHRATLGNNMVAMDQADEQRAALQEDVRQSLSDEVETDVVQSTLDMLEAQAAMQAALAQASRILAGFEQSNLL